MFLKIIVNFDNGLKKNDTVFPYKNIVGFSFFLF